MQFLRSAGASEILLYNKFNEFILPKYVSYHRINNALHAAAIVSKHWQGFRVFGTIQAYGIFHTTQA